MRNLDDLFAALATSGFRQRFRLRGKELSYLRSRGLPAILAHGAEIIDQRLAAAEPANDGKQTPLGNHPVFVAQHATATCCRGCLAKWHRIPKGQALTGEQKQYILKVLERWLMAQAPAAQDEPRSLFDPPPD